ncbi:MAG: tRNA (adenosine(37)-N6)-threonylcarbamoyltransferase complex ATPase subunit type 1 TsaE [Clostridia bacterium]|jgi:tRNA threonylcarbamoyladenosine biosynthesis protein TsaE|nr:tRNA (adenosine(37)-N6)-threonylcarbamoyltransferase complex ATPase subunit type 1 TsaE [Clostridia bacterium]
MEKAVFDITTETPERTEILGGVFSRYLENGSFVAMYGDLGAGKTAFVRGIVRKLIPEAYVTSPTYTIVNEYVGNDIKICHFDMYRIESGDDLESIGFYDYLRDGICIAEWCENIKDELPEQRYEIYFEKLSENERRISIIKIWEEEE